jgi:hypothetical protein
VTPVGSPRAAGLRNGAVIEITPLTVGNGQILSPASIGNTFPHQRANATSP